MKTQNSILQSTLLSICSRRVLPALALIWIASSSNLGATEFTPRVMIAEAPFASADALVQSGTLLDIPGSYVMEGEYRNDEKIKLIHAPLLLIHGIADKFIDIEKNSAVIFRNANDPKEFVRVPGADHSTIPAAMGEAAYCDTVRSFILRY